MRVADDALYQAKRAGKNAIRLGAPGLGVADPLLAEADFDRLLELIVTKAREATVADAGSLYLMEDPSSEARVLRFVVAQNVSRAVRVEEVRLPVDRNSVAGYVAATGKVINVADVYDLPPDAEFHVDPRMDRRTGYRTVSMLGVPLIDHAGQVMGVLQLINKKQEAFPAGRSRDAGDGGGGEPGVPERGPAGGGRARDPRGDGDQGPRRRGGARTTRGRTAAAHPMKAARTP